MRASGLGRNEEVSAPLHAVSACAHACGLVRAARRRCSLPPPWIRLSRSPCLTTICRHRRRPLLQVVSTSRSSTMQRRPRRRLRWIAQKLRRGLDARQKSTFPRPPWRATRAAPRHFFCPYMPSRPRSIRPLMRETRSRSMEHRREALRRSSSSSARPTTFGGGSLLSLA